MSTRKSHHVTTYHTPITSHYFPITSHLYHIISRLHHVYHMSQHIMSRSRTWHTYHTHITKESHAHHFSYHSTFISHGMTSIPCTIYPQHILLSYIQHSISAQHSIHVSQYITLIFCHITIISRYIYITPYHIYHISHPCHTNIMSHHFHVTLHAYRTISR